MPTPTSFEIRLELGDVMFPRFVRLVIGVEG